MSESDVFAASQEGNADMSDAMGGNGGAAELKRRAERRRNVLDQIDDLKTDLKALKAEDKDDGYNEKALAQCIKEMRKGADFQCAQLTLELEVDTYRRACDLPVTLEAAQEAASAEARVVPAVDGDADADEPAPARKGRLQ